MVTWVRAACGWGLVCCLLTVACGPTNQVGSTVGATPSPSFVASASPPKPSPVEPSPAASPTHKPLSCRLPVYAGGSGSAGFIQFPAANFEGDPKSATTLPSPAPTATPTPTGPYGPQGSPDNYGYSYDLAFKRWLPVVRAMVAPDGKHYVYPETDDGMYWVDVASGAQKAIGAGHLWNVLDVETEGVYANVINNQSNSQPAGLWLIPVDGSPARQIITSGYWQGVGYGAAWGYLTSSVPSGASWNLYRLNLKTLAADPWGSSSGPTVTIGFSAKGDPVLSQPNPNVQPQQNQPPPGATSVITAVGVSGATAPFAAFGNAVGDSHGVWISSGYGIFLWDGIGTDFRQVANIGGNLAGTCT